MIKTKIRIAAVSMADEFRKPKTVADNLRYIEETINEISLVKADIVALPEVFPFADIQERNFPEEEARQFLSRTARKNNICIAGSIYEKRGGRTYNTCLLVNRKGEIAGRYDKMHPTKGELKKGIFPGRKKQKPVDTEFGKIGFRICFDANWHEDWKYQADRGAGIIIFSSAYPGGAILNSIALLNQVFIIPSTWSLHTGIIDNTGRWMVQTDRFSWWVWRDISTEKTVFHWDWQGHKIKDIVKQYGDRVRIETYGPEALFTIEPVDPEISIKEIIKKFKLVSYKNYIRNSSKLQEKFRC